MKTLFWISSFVLVFLIVATSLPPLEDVVPEAQRYFPPDQSPQIAQGQAYHSQARWIMWGRVTAQFLFLWSLVLSPLGKTVYRWAGERVHFRWFPHVLLLGAFYWFGSWLIAWPFRIASYWHLVAWDMMNQSILSWLGDHMLWFVLSTIVYGGAFLGLYGLMNKIPQLWWLVAGVIALIFGFVLAILVPEVVAPMFNTFVPLNKTPFKTLEPRLRKLGQPYGIVPDDIFVVNASRQSKHSNAYYTGLAFRQKIVLYDNLLTTHGNADEVETIVAHEMGHWYYNHIVYGLLLGGAALTAGLFLLHLYLRHFVESGVWRSPADPAGVFLVLLLAHLAMAVALPFECAVSRHFERQADEVSLDLARKPEAFIEAEKRLAKTNKSDVAPSRLNVLLFYTHPPVVDRIRMAEAWRDTASREKKP
jgi:STE24 endopeptidase